ncbi:MAG: PEP-CTERM sorting domain-containing protein [Opitutales bacterium]
MSTHFGPILAGATAFLMLASAATAQISTIASEVIGGPSAGVITAGTEIEVADLEAGEGVLNITVGGITLQLKDFTVQGSPAATAPDINDFSVLAVEDTGTNFAGIRILVDGMDLAGAPGAENSTLRYSVMVLDGAVNAASLAFSPTPGFDASGLDNEAVVSELIIETDLSGVTSLSVFASDSEEQLSDSDTFDPITAFFVTKDFGIQAGSDESQVAITEIDELYGVVPEPSTYALIFGGIALALGLARRRFTQSA